MKRILLLIVLCVFVSFTAYSATAQRTILSHNGILTQYDATHWQDAINDAVAGDTVYFTPGVFEYGLTIDKAITLIGAGVSEGDSFWKDKDINDVYAGCGTTDTSTRIIGDVTINIPGSIMLTATLMEGFALDNVYVLSPVTNMVIKRCQANTFKCGDWSSAPPSVTNPVFESCFFSQVQGGGLVNPDFHNCYIHQLAYASELEFLNCAIIENHECSGCTLINCIYPSIGYSTCVNSVRRAGDEDVNSTYSNCWYEENAQCLTKEQLTDKGYIGIDGTVVGPLGGPAPFTLIPSQPYVSSSSITYLKSTKKLNVNVTVKQGK